MQFFNLDFLQGPGDSLAENFELLNLELARIDLAPSEVFRLSPPDGGIDIFSIGRPDRANVAFQCKAYRKYRSDLLPAIRESVASANRATSDYKWDIYYLVIPFVPTKDQRAKIALELKECRGESHICDADEIESGLFRHQQVANRFFPRIIIASSCDGAGFVLGLPGSVNTRSIDLTLHLREWGQSIPITVSEDATVRGLLNLIIAKFSLPFSGNISAGLSHSWGQS